MDSYRLDRIAFMTDSGVKTRIGVMGENSGNLIWRSSDPRIASVRDDGTVVAHRKGDTVVTAEAPDGRILSCRVTVDRQGQNPILPPTWGLFIADGEPRVFDGRVYVYGSRDVPNGFTEEGQDWCSGDYHVIWSEDLIHWTDAGVSLRLEDIPAEIRGNATRLWAPDCFRDPKTGKFFLLSCTNLGGIILSESDSPVGPFVNHRAVTWNRNRFSCIDPGVLIDGDKVYLALPKFAVMQLDPEDYSRVLPETYTTVTQWMDRENDPFEGPSLRSYDGIFYYIYIKNRGHVSDNGAIPTYMGYMTAPSPFGPYTDRGVIADGFDYLHAGNIHGSLVEFKGQRYLFHHVPFADLTLTRTMCGEKLNFRSDGTIETAEHTSSGVRPAFRMGEIIEAGSAAAFSGGRSDCRLISRTERNRLDGRFVTAVTGSPYVVFRKTGDGVIYRYLDFSGKTVNARLTVRTEASGGILSLYSDGQCLGERNLPDTRGNWCTLSFPAASHPGRHAIEFILTACPEKGEIALDSFSLLDPDCEP